LVNHGLADCDQISLQCANLIGWQQISIVTLLIHRRLLWIHIVQQRMNGYNRLVGGMFILHIFITLIFVFSFPSGHSSVAMFLATFCVLYAREMTLLCRAAQSTANEALSVAAQSSSDSNANVNFDPKPADKVLLERSRVMSARARQVCQFVTDFIWSNFRRHDTCDE
jgi:hypothetical protein